MCKTQYKNKKQQQKQNKKKNKPQTHNELEMREFCKTADTAGVSVGNIITSRLPSLLPDAFRLSARF